jgi:hypothetical protein
MDVRARMFRALSKIGYRHMEVLTADLLNVFVAEITMFELVWRLRDMDALRCVEYAQSEQHVL